MKATVILNARSKQAAKVAARIPELLGRAGVRLAGFHLASDGADLERRVRRAVRDGARNVIVGGGDGAMTLAVRALAKSDSTMGVLPLGTGNSFADSLRIPFDLEGAVDVIAKGIRTKVDLGVVNGTYFACFATIGFPSQVARATNHDLKQFMGMVAYAAAAFGPFFFGESFRAKVRTGAQRFTNHTRHLIIANGRYFGHNAMTSDASIVDGELTLYTTDGASRFDLLRAYAALGLGMQAHVPGVHLLNAKKIDVETSPRQPLDVDGSKFGRTPARFRVARKALRVYVPQEFIDAHGT